MPGKYLQYVITCSKSFAIHLSTILLQIDAVVSGILAAREIPTEIKFLYRP
jgi:hypothetical protein